MTCSPGSVRPKDCLNRVEYRALFFHTKPCPCHDKTGKDLPEMFTKLEEHYYTKFHCMVMISHNWNKVV